MFMSQYKIKGIYAFEQAILTKQLKSWNHGYNLKDNQFLTTNLYFLCNIAKLLVNIARFVGAIFNFILSVFSPKKGSFEDGFNTLRFSVGNILLNIANILVSFGLIFTRGIASILQTDAQAMEQKPHDKEIRRYTLDIFSSEVPKESRSDTVKSSVKTGLSKVGEMANEAADETKSLLQSMRSWTGF